MRFGVETSEIWQLAAATEEVASGLMLALAAVGVVLDDGVGSWCVHPEAVSPTVTAVDAVHDHARAGRSAAGGLAAQLAAAAQAYVDVDTPRPR